MRNLGRAVESRFGWQSTLATAASAHTSFHCYGINSSPDPGTIPEALLGAGLWNLRDPMDGPPALPSPAPSLTVPLDLNTMGVWLRAMCGAPTTTGSSPDFTHVFTTGAETLPALSLQHRFATGDFVRRIGCVADTMQLRLAKAAEFGRVELGFQARSETNETAWLAGSVAAPPAALKLAQSRATVQIAGLTMGDVLSFDFSLSNNLERYAAMNGSEFPDEIDTGLVTASGTLTVRHRDRVLPVISAARSTHVLAVTITDPAAPATRYLNIGGESVRLVLQGRPVTGPDGIETQYAVEFRQTGANPAVRFTLLNGISSY